LPNRRACISNLLSGFPHVSLMRIIQPT
jgi:hypothetical protein